MSPQPASDKSFVHLHVHTEYSMLDGAARIDELFETAAEMGMPALATTDHGYVFGAYEFWSKAKKYGVKPIIGVEAYLTPGTHRTDKTRVKFGDGGRDDVSGSGAYTHMTLLARTTEGMHNLFRMSSLASMEGYYFKPRIDRELLATYGQGLIGTTGCAGGEIQTRLRQGQYREAVEAAAEFRDIFGAENFYCEVMDHGIDIERRTMKDLLRLSRDLGLPLLATNDLHYTKAEQAQAHAALLCVQSGSTLMDPNRFKFDADEFYLKSPEQMRHLWRELPEACDNTLLIAERCDVSVHRARRRLTCPASPAPRARTRPPGSSRRWSAGCTCATRPGSRTRCASRSTYETEVIVSKGYPGYFLVVADFIGWAKKNGIRVGPGRGSGAGSMCAYVMEITDLDPLKHGLIFERFLNPERASMPDFDIDFDERRRGEVIHYVTAKYGEERVAQIVTYGTIKAKQAVKDAARVMGFPFAMGEKLTKAMPPAIMGKDVPLSGIFDPKHKRYAEAATFRQVHDEDPQAQEVVKTALGLEGLKRQWGVHAAGVIMSSEPLLDLIPIMRREQDGQIITQFDYPSCETLGLVKMDFLGLRNLTILDDALINVRDQPRRRDRPRRAEQDPGRPGHLRAARPRRHPGRLPVRRRAHARAAAADEARQLRGHLGGRRALPSRPDGRQLAHQLRAAQEQPAGDLLPAPGPRAGAGAAAGHDLRPDRLSGAGHGDRPEARRLHARQGGPVAPRDGQEEARCPGRRVRRLRGRHGGQRLQPGRHQGPVGRPGPLLGLRVQQGAQRGIRPGLVLDRLPEGQLPGRVHGSGADQRARRQGQVGALPQRVPPDGHQGPAAGRQRELGQLHRGRHRHPVRAGRHPQRRPQRGRGDRGRAARTRGGSSRFEDFLRKAPAVVCNKRTIESLVKAGSFDSLQHTRQGLVRVHEAYVDALVDEKKQEAIGQDSLFGGFDDADGDGDGAGTATSLLAMPPIPTIEWDKATLLAFEREMLGLYVSDHPLFGIEHVLSQHADTSIAALTGDDSKPDGANVTIAGLITGLQIKRTKKGDLWAIATVEDLDGAIECLFFPSAYMTVSTMLGHDVVCVVRGRLNRRDETPDDLRPGAHPARHQGRATGTGGRDPAADQGHQRRGRADQGGAG